MTNYHLKRFSPSQTTMYPNWLRSLDVPRQDQSPPIATLARENTVARTVGHRTQGVVLSILIVPGSPHTRIVEINNDALKCHIAAPIAQQHSNNLLLQLLSKLLHVPIAHMTILTGGTSRNKQVRIGGIAPQRVLYLLRRFIA